MNYTLVSTLTPSTVRLILMIDSGKWDDHLETPTYRISRISSYIVRESWEGAVTIVRYDSGALAREAFLQHKAFAEGIASDPAC